MSRRSQEKRAARAKTRARERARTANGAGASPAYEEASWFRGGFAPRPGPTPADVLDQAGSGVPFSIWHDDLRGIEPAMFLSAAEPVLVAWMRMLYGAGWQPTELIRYAKQMGKAGAAGLARLAMAAERETRTGPTASDARWLQQWSAAGLPDEAVGAGWLAAWAAADENWPKHIYRLGLALHTAPVLDVLLPPPPGIRAARPLVGRPARASMNPMLERVRALLAKAESTEHESEAFAFTGKAQELMTRHAISQAMVNHAGEHKDVPNMIRIPMDPPYMDAKALLLQTVAGHSRCRTMLLPSVNLSSVVGFPADLDVVEMLFTSLLVQAQHALAEISAHAPPGAPIRSQSFKASFLQGFIHRIDHRLTEVTEETFDGAKRDAATFLPVLRAQEEEVRQFMDRQFTHSTMMGVRGGYDSAGYSRGQQAGAAASLMKGRL